MKATVFIPTWFGEEYLDELLNNVFHQEVEFDYEVLIYDTSSTDSTQDIIKKYAKKHNNLRYKVITKDEFGHGKTRQAAAEDAKGEFIVYLSQDATPADKNWLREMVAPFSLNEKVVAVLGKQEPRAHAFPLLKYEIRAVFGNLGPDLGTTLYQNDTHTKDKTIIGALGFYSDVNSATRRDFLLNEIPYRDVPYAEDQLFGKDIIEAGYIKAYAPRGRVLHSNDITLREYKYRMFDETMGLRRVGFEVPVPGRKMIAKAIAMGVLKDWVRTLRDDHYSLKRKAYWLVMNPLFHIEKWRGVRLAAKVELSDSDTISQMSLEQIKHKSNK